MAMGILLLPDGHSLFHANLGQGTQTHDELDIDSWLTFSRKNALLLYPALELFFYSNLPWRFDVLVSRTGKHTATIGHLDPDDVKSLNGYHQVTGYHKDLGKPLLTVLQ